MNSNHPGRRWMRRLAGAGLLTLVAGVLAAPSFASAATTPATTALSTTSWTQTLILSQPRATLTVAEVKRMAEAAARSSLGPVDAALVVEGDARALTSASVDQLLTGYDTAGLRLLWRTAGAIPGTTLDQLTAGVVPGQQAGDGIGNCNQCTVTVIVVNPPPPTQAGDGIGTCKRCIVVVIVINVPSTP